MKHFTFYLVATLLIAWLILNSVPRIYSGPGKAGYMRLNAEEVGRGINLYKKRFGEYPTGENATIIKKLSGQNPHHDVLIEHVSKSINWRGQIVDMWRQPLKFEFEGTNNFIINSAGPNEKFGDGDDVILYSSTNQLHN